ncbi:hypothetical protein V8G54_014792 [Vigna mungo]|uniref:Uncharacterized protein n=1 Tax=Vigna mungo TaxID=3915 RepID=A0AAQ3RXS8_VIGMU
MCNFLQLHSSPEYFFCDPNSDLNFGSHTHTNCSLEMLNFSNKSDGSFTGGKFPCTFLLCKYLSCKVPPIKQLSLISFFFSYYYYYYQNEGITVKSPCCKLAQTAKHTWNY